MAKKKEQENEETKTVVKVTVANLSKASDDQVEKALAALTSDKFVFEVTNADLPKIDDLVDLMIPKTGEATLGQIDSVAGFIAMRVVDQQTGIFVMPDLSELSGAPYLLGAVERSVAKSGAMPLHAFKNGNKWVVGPARPWLSDESLENYGTEEEVE